MALSNRSKRGLRWCCGVTVLLTIILLVVTIVLFLTILKPKEPKIITEGVTLEYVRLIIFPIFQLNVSLGVEVEIDNPNYGSFKYQNSTTHITYRGKHVADAPIAEDTIPSRGKHNVSTSVLIEGEKLVLDSNFSGDYNAGCLNFTSSTTLHGKAIVMKFIKIKATSYSTCDISVFVHENNATSVCSSKFKY
ncbi:uncharacterized protein LOC132278291 [Cornus florida]|uniref:uncharacterized protein LOC132278291 n=1 Tax=Cornus florida TaxID=4283 RepID=UPI002896B5B4|nr:uncharacterized protein LOC132278291 [Cornus florida]